MRNPEPLLVTLAWLEEHALDRRPMSLLCVGDAVDPDTEQPLASDGWLASGVVEDPWDGIPGDFQAYDLRPDGRFHPRETTIFRNEMKALGYDTQSLTALVGFINSVAVNPFDRAHILALFIAAIKDEPAPPMLTEDWLITTAITLSDGAAAPQE